MRLLASRYRSPATRIIRNRRAMAAAIEGFEPRKLMSGNADDAADLHIPGCCNCAGCLPQADGQMSLAQAMKEGIDIPTADTRAPLSALPLLSSRPGAPVTVHLDFDGTPPFEFNSSTGLWASGPLPGNSDPIPAFSIDGNFNDFTNAEINAINLIWQQVSEKFSPFDINVTTIAPPNYNDGVAVHAIMGGSDADWLMRGAGGIAPLNAFTNGRPNSAFTFTADAVDAGSVTLNNGDRHFIAETAAHEVGHTLGLEHQSVVSGSVVTVEYSNGTATTTPIMGNSSNQLNRRGLWWNGPASARDGNNNLVSLGNQDDLAVMTRPGNHINYRTDDYGSFGGSGSISVDPTNGFAQASGVIETHGDQDAFIFTAIGPIVSFTANNATYGGMLAPSLELIPLSGSAGGNVTTTNNNTSGTLSATGVTPGGAYLLRVGRQGTEYGSIGQYYVTGSTGAFAGISSGTIGVAGYNTNNDLKISYNSSNDNIVLQNNVFGGQAIQQFPRSQVTAINVLFGHMGNDIIDLFGQFTALNVPVSINAGAGTDTFISQGTTGDDVFTLVSTSSSQTNNTPVTFNSIESITLSGFAGADTFNVWNSNVPVTLNGGTGDDTFTLGQDVFSFLTINAPVSIFGDDGSDTLNMGNGNADAINAGVTFNAGGGGWLDTVDYNDGGKISTVEYDINATTVSRLSAVGSAKVLTYSGLDDVEIFAGSGGDQFTVRNGAVPAGCFGNGGNDNFIFGDGLLSPGGGQVFNGGQGLDQLTFDDRNKSSAVFWDIQPDRVVLNSAFIFLTAGFERVAVLSGNGNDTLLSSGGTYGQEITLDAGGGIDSVIVRSTRITRLTARGGTDSVHDYLEVDDRNLLANMVGGSIYADHISRDIDALPPAPSDVYYSGFSAVDWRQQNHQNVITVYGISPDIGVNNQFFLAGGTLDDIVDVYPRDAQGNPTVLGNLYFQGGDGPDTLNVVTTGSAPTSYRLYEPSFAFGNVFIDSPGNRWIGAIPTVERVTVTGGGGNDSFAVEQLKSGAAVQINGGGGDDTCTIGNGDMSGNLTNASFFGFNGQGGTGDRFTIANGSNGAQWSYRVTAATIASFNFFTGYQWVSSLQGIEAQAINAGPLEDTFFVDAVAAGVSTELNGGGGLDGLAMGELGALLQNVLGPVTYVGGAAGGTVSVNDGADTTGDIVHLTANTLGKYPADTLFGPGGSLTFTGLANNGPLEGFVLSLGSGADTVYAQPLASARALILGSNPAAAPGDSLNLATAGVQNSSITGTPSSGQLTGSNVQPMNWFGFEGSVQSDAVAPAVVNAALNVNGIPGAGDGESVVSRQAISVQFSENVAGLLSPASLSLTNSTTGQTVPSGNIAVEYVAATNTANFTFPGYPGGVLPDGNYTGRILAGLPDFFGNPLTADVPFSFFFLQGDANASRRVDIDDFGILAARFNQPATYTQGDFNYSGVVDIDDFAILATKFNQFLGPAALRPPGAGSSFSDRRIEEEPLIDLLA